MRKRYKIVLNIELTDPDTPYPAGGDYTHLTRIQENWAVRQGVPQSEPYQ